MDRVKAADPAASARGLGISMAAGRSAMTWCTLVVLSSVVPHACKWPWEYANPRDPQPAPGPPAITQPAPDTTIWWHGSNVVLFTWTTAPGAQSYQIQVDTTSLYTSGEDLPFHIIVNADSSPGRVAFPGVLVQRYCCRIRALSTAWEQGMTEWSRDRWVTMKRQQALAVAGLDQN